MSEHKPQAGMSVAQATRLEYAIIGIGLVALLMIFQPFSLALFSIGCALVVAAGLINNLLPLCEPGVPIATVARIALIIAVIFIVVTVLAIGSAWLYGVYLTSQQ
jgi:hypothetical protein